MSKKQSHKKMNSKKKKKGRASNSSRNPDSSLCPIPEDLNENENIKLIECGSDEEPELPTETDDGKKLLYVKDDTFATMWAILDMAKDGGSSALQSTIDQMFPTKEARDELCMVHACFMRFVGKVSALLDVFEETEKDFSISESEYVGFLEHIMTLGKEVVAELLVKNMSPILEDDKRSLFFTDSGHPRKNEIQWMAIVPQKIEALS